MKKVFLCAILASLSYPAIASSLQDQLSAVAEAELKWFTEFGHLNRGDMLTSEQHRCHNEKKKFQRRV
ncbi:transposase [Escherichia coli]|nr:transposase [Escherichia coli]